MIFYASQTEICRENLILRYFGEKPKEKCGKCDVCKKEKSKLTKRSVLDFLEDAPKTVQQIMLHFVHSPRESVMEILQELSDENWVQNHGIDSYQKTIK